jgi:riboflavin kinase / FMN adenylyltransferase
MNVFRAVDGYRDEKRCVVSVGNFDGVHRGHAGLVDEVVARARSAGLASTIVTFEPHTRAVVEPGRPQPILSTLEEKAILLGQRGVENLVVIDFDDTFRRLSAAEFAGRILKERLGAAQWVMGAGHTFGRDRAGNKNSLHTIVSENDISLITVKLLADGEHVVSSTGLRGLITRGELARAVEILGHPYLVAARHVRGKGVGRTLGFPTLNFQRPPSEKVLPPAGVYAAHLQRESKKLPGALYFGTCPTFDAREAHFEFYLFSAGFEEPTVGDTAELWIHRHVRPDRAFANAAELVAQMDKDVVQIKHFFVEEK